MADTAIYIIKGEATAAQRAWAENRYQLFDRMIFIMQMVLLKHEAIFRVM